MHRKALVPEHIIQSIRRSKRTSETHELHTTTSLTHTTPLKAIHVEKKTTNYISAERHLNNDTNCAHISQVCNQRFFKFALHISNSYFYKDVFGDKVTSPVNLLRCKRATPEQYSFPLGCEACPSYYAIDFHNHITSSPGSLRGVVLSPKLCGFSPGC